MKLFITILAGAAILSAYLWLACRMGKRLSNASKDCPTPDEGID